jgi:hypothetical protein
VNSAPFYVVVNDLSEEAGLMRTTRRAVTAAAGRRTSITTTGDDATFAMSGKYRN